MNAKQIRASLGFLLLFVAAYVGTGSAPWMIWGMLAIGYLGVMIVMRKPHEPTKH